MSQANNTIRYVLKLPLVLAVASVLLQTIVPLGVPLFRTALSLPLKQSGDAPRVAAIVLLHMYDAVHFFRRLGELTGENKERYAKRHGYEIVFSTPHRTSGILKQITCPTSTQLNNANIRGPDSQGKCYEEDNSFDIDHSRAPTFGKIKLSLACCVGRPDAWLLWGDADSMIINQSVPLESIIDDGYDLIFSYDWLMLNAGMLLIKCSPWTLNFLQNVYDARKFDTARALDQSALQEFIDKLPDTERRAHIKVIPKYAMDVYTEEYRPGDFLMHFAGKLYEATEPGLVAIANQYDILSMADDIEDIEAFFRGKHLLNYYSGTCKVNLKERQRDCRPEDPRRIILNESLGSMSYPNRYRHVGLRYYWLGAWKDKYDVPGWDQFIKPLAVVSREERQQHLQHAHPKPPPDALHDHEDHQQDEPPQAVHEQEENPASKINKPGAVDDDNDDDANDDADDENVGNIKDAELHDHDKHPHDVPEVHHDIDPQHEHEHDMKDPQHLQHHGDPVGNKDDDQLAQHDDDEEGEEDSPSSSYIWLFVTVAAIGAAVLFIVLTRRRKMSSKTQ